MGDFPYVEWLARLYKKVGEFSGSWTDYIKVFIMILINVQQKLIIVFIAR